MKYNHFIILLFIITPVLFSQEIFKNFNTSNSGILSNSITKIAINNQGDVWCGTGQYYSPNYGKGISILKNQTQTWSKMDTSNSEILSNDVTAINFDSSDNAYIGYMGKGLSIKTGSAWLHYDILISGSNQDKITFIFVDNKNIWAGTYFSGLYLFTGEIWERVKYSEVESVAKDNSGNMWFGSLHTLLKYNGRNWTTYSLDSTGDPVNALAVDFNENVWLGLEGTGVIKFDGKYWEYIKSPFYEGDDYINSIIVDKNRNLWFGTNKGLWLFNGTDWNYDFLKNNYITSLALDNNNNIWIGTKGQGLYKLTYNEADSDTNSIKNQFLFQNYPNPFNGSTVISFQVDKSEFVKLEIYNILGEKVTDLINQFMTTS